MCNFLLGLVIETYVVSRNISDELSRRVGQIIAFDREDVPLFNSLVRGRAVISAFEKQIVTIRGKRRSRRPHQKTLDWTTDKVNRETYGHLKEKAKRREK